MDVTTAEDGMVATELVKKQKFDVIISDIIMPEMTGIEFLRKAKEIDPDCCFIIVTACGEKEPAIEAIRYGAFRFIEKPFNVEELVQAIETGYKFKRLIDDKNKLLSSLQDAFEILVELKKLYFDRAVIAENAQINSESNVSHENKKKQMGTITASMKLENRFSEIKKTLDKYK